MITVEMMHHVHGEPVRVLALLAAASCCSCDVDGANATVSSSGGGATSMLSLVEPIERDGKYVLEFGSTLFEVDPGHGGRITAFSLHNSNILTAIFQMDPSGDDWLNGGSTYWTSPQTAWGWPPIGAIDDEPYTATLDGTTIVLRSVPAKVGDAQIRVEKRFTADLQAEAVDIEYIVTNLGPANIEVAGWEITRVAPSGLSFFPTGAGASTAAYNAPLPVVTEGEHTWYDTTSTEVTLDVGHKMIADGARSWLAHVTAERTLFVKTFDDLPVSAQAPSEGAVELYTNGRYVELENQGRYKKIRPGNSSSFAITWRLRRVPDAVPVEIGSAGLLSFVDGVVSRTP